MLRLVKIILIVAIGLLLGYILFSKPSSQKVLDTKEYTEKIDSLESEISIIRTKKDSINRVIDTVYVEIENNNKRYEENSNIIIGNSTNDNYLFFTDYISRNKSRLDSICNL